MRLLYRMCDTCLYIGTRNRDFYAAHGVSDRKLFLVPYTVDNEAIASRADASPGQSEALRSRLGLPTGRPVVLFASKLISRKRPADVVAAFAELGRRGIAAVLLMVGDGEQRGRVEREAKSIGPGHVIFTGFVNQRDLPAYYGLADVFVLPSENEPWGLAINEAMACGVPVVTTREVGAAVDLVEDGITGFTYATGDVAALADVLAKVLTDRALRGQMRANCRTRMKTWSYAECIQGIRAALHQVAPRLA